MHKFNLRITAVFLLLVLTQSMGMRIMLHNKFHHTTSSFPKTSPSYIQIACDCIDEALMPGTQAQAVELVIPEKAYFLSTDEQRYYLPAIAKLFHSLRAPPAC